MADEVIPGGPLADVNQEIDLADVEAGDLQALIDEHSRQGLGTLWLYQIRKATPRVARRYSPGYYARSSAWDDDAINDLVQDVVERMITKGQAEYICDAANDFDHARALIYRQVRMTLIDRRQRTVVDNLYDRAVDRLGAAPFEQVRKKPRSWRLIGSEAEPIPYTSRLTASLAALPRLPGNGAERASALWTAETMTDALTLLCGAVGEVEESDLKRIFDEALTVFATAEVVSNDAGAQDRSAELDPGELTLANDLAERIVAALTKEEATMLAGKWIGDSDGDIARRLGVSRPTAAKYKDSAFEKVRAELADQTEALISEAFGRLQSLVIRKAEGGAA
ncbi:hypothetical protein GCM10027568_22190 [Humibacter soli]